jgi:hypothetical protein
VPVDCAANGANVHFLKGLNLPPAQFAVGNKVVVIVVFNLWRQVLIVNDTLVCANEVKLLAAVGTRGVVAPPPHHTFVTEYMSASQFSILFRVVSHADYAPLLVRGR